MCIEVVLEGEAQLIQHLVANNPADANAARSGQRLQARRDIDAITKDIVAVDDDVADIDADPKLESLIGRNAGITLGHAALDIHGAAHGIARLGS
jgi:chemotaxis regulatin CheY-phosphate phosphatase CheZ